VLREIFLFLNSSHSGLISLKKKLQISEMSILTDGGHFG
jgi:hypothetical protein